MKKLNSIIVSDDNNTVEALTAFCQKSDTTEVIRVFSNSNEFLKSLPALNFDYCIIDADIQDVDGLMLMQMLNGRPFLIITAGESGRLKEIINLSPIDVVLKPILKEKLDKALKKAHKLLASERKYALFRVAESDLRVNLSINDIGLIITDDIDSRHKTVYMKNGDKYTLMNCSLDELMAMSPLFIQANKSIVVNIDVIHQVTHDEATIKSIWSDEAPKYVNIGLSYKSRFLEKLFYV